MAGITIHPEHGVNPSMIKCFWCGEGDFGIALLGYNKGNEAPREVVLDYKPCDCCKETMAKGVVLMEGQLSPIDTRPPIQENPQTVYPTGRWMVVQPEAVAQMFDVPVEDKAFVDVEAYNQLVEGFANAAE